MIRPLRLRERRYRILMSGRVWDLAIAVRPVALERKRQTMLVSAVI
jgi:hypothetical protein